MMQIGREIIGHRWCRDFMKRLSLIGSGQKADGYLPPDEEYSHDMVHEPMSQGQMGMEQRMEIEQKILIDLAHEALSSVDETFIKYAKSLLCNYGINHKHTSDEAIKIINEHMRTYHASQPIFIGNFSGYLNGNVQQVVPTEEERRRISMMFSAGKLPATPAGRKQSAKDAQERGRKVAQERGRKVAHLFMDAAGEQDRQLTEKMAHAFRDFLSRHHYLAHAMLESKKENPISQAFIVFCRRSLAQLEISESK